MAVRLICPDCAASVRVSDGAAGRTARCPECGAKFAAPDDEDERPRPKKRAPHDADEDDRPRRGPNWPLLAGAGAALLVGLAAVIGLAFALGAGGKRDAVDATPAPAPDPVPEPPRPPAPPAPVPADDRPPARFRLATGGRVPADAPVTADLAAAPARALDPAAGTPLGGEWEGAPTALRVLPNGVVAVGAGGSVTFWDVAADKAAGVVALDRPGQPDRDRVRSVAALSATPDGATLLVVGRMDAGGRVVAGVDVPGRKLAWRNEWGTRGAELTLSTSADGRVAFVGLAKPASGTVLTTVDPRTGQSGPRRTDTNAAAVGSPDERRAVIVNRPPGGDFTLSVWDSVRDATLGTALTVPGKGAADAALAVSPDGRALAFAAGAVLYVVETNTGRLVHKVKLPAVAGPNLSFSAAGRLLAWHDDPAGKDGSAAHVFDLAAGTEVARVAAPEGERVGAAALAPDGSAVFVAVGPAVARYPLPPLVPDTAAFPSTPPATHKPAAAGPAVVPPAEPFRAPAELVTVPGNDAPTYTLARTPPKVFAADDGYLVNPLDRAPDLRGVAALPDGTVATVGRESVRLWNPFAGRPEGEMRGADLDLRHVVAAPDGGRLFALAVPAQVGGAARVAAFDVRKRAEAWRHSEKVNRAPWRDLGVSPDGSRVWVGGGFPAAHVRAAVLDAATGAELALVDKRTAGPSPDPLRGFFVARDAKVEEYTFGLRDPAGGAVEVPYLKLTADPKDRTRRLDDLRALALSPSGRRLAFVLRNQLLVLETGTGRVLHRVELNHPIWAPPVFSPDERFLAWRDGDQLAVGGRAGYLFDLAAGREVARFEPVEKALVRGLAFTADGRALVVVMGEVLLRFPVPPA